MNVGQSIMMIDKWSRSQLGQPEERIVHRGIPSPRRVARGVGILELIARAFGHSLPDCPLRFAVAVFLAAVCRPEDFAAVPFFIGVVVVLDFRADAFLAAAFFAGADCAPRATASSSCSRREATSARNAWTSSARAKPSRPVALSTSASTKFCKS